MPIPYALQIIISVVVGYMLGSINPAIIISYTAFGKDIRNYGSGNAGFTNSMRTLGWKRAMLVLAGDMAKTAIAVLIGQLVFAGGFDLSQGTMGRIITGAAVLVGHIFPVYYRFKGGKGIAATATIIAFFDIRVFAVTAAVFFLVLLLTRFVSLSSMLAASSVPISTYLFYTVWSEKTRLDVWQYVAIWTAVALFVIFMHRANIKRLLKNEESRFVIRKKGLLE